MSIISNIFPHFYYINAASSNLFQNPSDDDGMSPKRKVRKQITKVMSANCKTFSKSSRLIKIFCVSN